MKQTPVWRFLIGGIVLVILISACQPKPTPIEPVPATPTPTKPEEVTLTMGSWRTDDIEQMNRILAKFHEKYPSITIQYETYSTSDVAIYNPIIESMLKQGTAPDIFYLTSYGFSRKLYEDGYLEPLDSLTGLDENFSTAMRAPWATDLGTSYGVPFIATSHAIYYNRDIFNTLKLTPPKSWEELLQIADRIQQAGIIPFANSSGDTWTMAEVVFMNLAPSFIGGYEGRKAYLDGERCFSDASIVRTFQAVKDIAPYLPENQNLLNNSDSFQLFVQGRAAMWLNGSWDIPFIEAQNPAFQWSVFAVPPPAGQPSYITFHLDAGMGLNAASKYKEEARLFLEWMTTPEFGELLGNELPGFFPMHAQPIVLEDEHANAFLKLNEGRGQDVRFSWEKISDGIPDAYTLISDGTIAVVNGTLTPQQAADNLQSGLEKWYLPAQKCKK